MNLRYHAADAKFLRRFRDNAPMRATFDCFELDSERRALFENGERVRLSPKGFRLLEVLVTNSPRALSKQELHDAIWPKTFVEESNLAGLVTELRSALKDEPRHPRFVRTVHGFGYAFCGELTAAAARLRAASVSHRGDDLPLFEGPNVLGRDGAADVLVDDSTVSRRHARIVVGPRDATIEDLASKNGTFLDGRRLEGGAVSLEEGQPFVLGDARLTFRRSLAAASTVTLHAAKKNVP